MPENYSVEIPEFNEKEKKVVEAVLGCLVKETSTEDLQKLLLKEKEEAELMTEVKEGLIDNIKENLSFEFSERIKARKKVKEFVQSLEGIEHENELIERITNELIGFGKLEKLVHDDELEEVMVNGLHKPVYVFHRRRGMLKTNLVIDSKRELEALVGKMSKEESEDKLFLDLNLRNRTRVNVTLPPASISPVLTIRKFSSKPFQLTDLVQNETMSSDIAAFLWTCVEGLKVRPMNVLITGGASSGKTTTLNTLSSVIRPDSRIISIEDTLELSAEGRDNWIQLETVMGQASMSDLIKDSLRMRPDRIIVGEVRGEEAESLFTAMDVGCAGSMGTIHANNVSEAFTRLKTPPMNVPKSMLPLLDVIVVQHRFDWPGKGTIRRVTEVSEVRRSGNSAATNQLFEWDKEKDEVNSKYLSSGILDKIAFGTAKSRQEVVEEIELRQAIIEWVIKKGLSFEKTVKKFYSDREALLEEVNRSF